VDVETDCLPNEIINDWGLVHPLVSATVKKTQCTVDAETDRLLNESMNNRSVVHPLASATVIKAQSTRDLIPTSQMGVSAHNPSVNRSHSFPTIAPHYLSSTSAMPPHPQA
jgi:hypothetical protein